MSRALRLFVCLLVVVAGISSSRATFKTVCPSGCDYTSLETAIHASSGSSSDPWTIQVQRGVYAIDASIEVNDKSYLTVEGLGMENTILQASEQWFENVTSASDFFMILDSDNITLRNIGIDVITYSGSGLDPASADVTGVFLDHANPVVIDSVSIAAVSWGLRDANPASNQSPTNNRLNMFNSKVSAQYFGAWLTGGSVWLVWSSEFHGEGGLTANTDPGVIGGLYINGGDPADARNVFTGWGCHFHAQSDHAGQLRGVDLEQMKLNDVSSFVGCTLHAKTTASTSTQVAKVTGLYAQTPYGAQVDVSGSEIVYEGDPDIPYGDFAGVFAAIGKMYVNLTGTSIVDRARDDSTSPATLAGATHYDIYRAYSGPPGTIQPTVHVIGSKAVSIRGNSSTTAQSLNTVEIQSGTSSLSSGSVTVTLPVPLPSTNYVVCITGNANETFRVSSKSATTFTVTSSNGSSTASVDWIVRF